MYTLYFIFIIIIIFEIFLFLSADENSNIDIGAIQLLKVNNDHRSKFSI